MVRPLKLPVQSAREVGIRAAARSGCAQRTAAAQDPGDLAMNPCPKTLQRCLFFLALAAVALPQARAQIFSAPAVYPAGITPRSLQSGDLNGDGAPDLVVLNFGGGTVSVFLNDGFGGMLPPTTLVTGGNPYRAAIGDINGDGRPDLVVSLLGGSDLLIYLGTGLGGLGGFLSSTPLAVGVTGPVALARLNGDTNLDIATGEVSYTIAGRLLFGNGQGQFGGDIVGDAKRRQRTASH